MERSLQLGLVLALASACLSTPPRKQPVPPEGPVFVDQPFPPTNPDFDLFIRAVRVADLNHDGKDDLLLANAPDATVSTHIDSLGVFVMLGGTADFGSVHQGFVPTPSAAPYATAVADITGGPELDLIVHGSVEAGGQLGSLLAFEWSNDPAQIYTPLARKNLLGNQIPQGVEPHPAGRPVFVSTLRLDDDGVPDVAFGDLDYAFTMRVDAWSQVGFDASAPVELTGFQVQRQMIAISPVQNAGNADVDDLMIGTLQYNYYFENVGSALLTATPDTSPMINNGVWFWQQFIDLDKDDTLDIAAAGHDELHGHLIDRTDPVTFTEFNWDLGTRIPGDGMQEDVLYLELDRDINLDWDAIRLNKETGNSDPSFLDVYTNVYIAQSGMGCAVFPCLVAPNTGGRALEPPVVTANFHPDIFGVGNFAGAGPDIWLITRAGEMQCVYWHSGAAQVQSCASRP